VVRSYKWCVLIIGTERFVSTPKDRAVLQRFSDLYVQPLPWWSAMRRASVAGAYLAVGFIARWEGDGPDLPTAVVLDERARRHILRARFRRRAGLTN